MTLEDWFEKWWMMLPKRHFTSQNKGSKREAWLELKKLGPDEALREKIMWHTTEMTRRTDKMRKMDAKVAPWKHAVRLLRYRFWDDELPAISEEREKAESRKCDCGRPVAVVDLCNACYDKTRPDPFARERRSAGERHGTLRQSGEPKQAYNARCRAWCKSNARRVLGNLVT